MEMSKNCTAPHRREAEEEEEDEDEEKKMEIFIALMKNFRNKLHQLQENHSRKRKRPSTTAGGWAPTFELEDFTADIQFKKPMPACNNNNNNIGNVEIINGRLLRPNSPSPPNLKLEL